MDLITFLEIDNEVLEVIEDKVLLICEKRLMLLLIIFLLLCIVNELSSQMAWPMAFQAPCRGLEPGPMNVLEILYKLWIEQNHREKFAIHLRLPGFSRGVSQHLDVPITN